MLYKVKVFNPSSEPKVPLFKIYRIHSMCVCSTKYILYLSKEIRGQNNTLSSV